MEIDYSKHKQVVVIYPHPDVNHLEQQEQS